ncbi:MAG TPA: right-handed parallel beta-helix repeat-containing protein [Anaerolineales bacterium]|nr:right-handed parallel beta-helix repeat-containing protein [Anaerolineales bacterium]
MAKKLLQSLFILVIWTSLTNNNALAVTGDVYVSPQGNDSGACTSGAPCRTIQKGVNTVQPGGVLHILAGTYAESVTVSKTGTPSAPIRIVGEGAVLSNGGARAFYVNNSQWVTFEGLKIRGYTSMDFEIKQSHFLTFRNNSLEYTFAALRIQEGVSHVLVEYNEMYQTYPASSTWSSLKGSRYEGAGVYASSGAQGMYFIRNNNFHDSMNGVYLSDSDAGLWMNANVFISGNTFRNIVDDPFEPEGDSFNIHFYNNTLINTHRIVSIVPASTCIGPIFVYGNFQQNTLDPTREASSGRRNSAIKMDMRGGSCPNGVWFFNNTVNANAAGTNFYAVDLLSTAVRNFQLLNNVFITEKNAYSSTPSLTNAVFDYNISLKPFGYAEPHGLQADPLLNSSGMLQSNSPAKGRGTSIGVNSYFASAQIVPAGSDLGGFRNFPSPVYVLPPGGEPASFPTNASGWPNSLPPTSTPASPTPSPMVSPTLTQTVTSTPILPTNTATPTLTQNSTFTAPTFTPTSVLTSTPLPLPTTTAPPPTATRTAPPAGVIETIHDDNNPALVYSGNWQSTSRDKAYGSSFKVTRQVGASITMSFTGQSFSLLYTSGDTNGKIDIYVDNVLIGTLDQRTSTVLFQQRWDTSVRFTAGAHQLKLIFTGPADTRGAIDAVIIR